MSSQDNNDLPNSFGNVFPLPYEDELPHSDHGESMLPSSTNVVTGHHASTTLHPPPPPQVTLLSLKLKDTKLLKPYWNVNIKMENMCVRMLWK